MKTLILATLVLLAAACADTAVNNTSGPMEGTPVGGQLEAYIQMCKRDPASELCPQNIPLTQSSAIQTMSEICREGNSFTWCDQPHTLVYRPSPNTVTESSRYRSTEMEGDRIRLRADAYARMCAREPESVLCP